MSQDLHDFGVPDYLEPNAIGRPGNRRFRLIARVGRRTASLWLEREQLRGLVDSIQQFLVQITGSDVLRSIDEATPTPPPERDFPDDSDIEFEIGPMTLGYDDENEAIIFMAAPLEIIEVEGEPTMNEDADIQFRALLPLTAIDQFIRDTEGLMAAGRPRCPLCGQPLDAPGAPHGCAKQNGHHKIADVN